MNNTARARDVAEEAALPPNAVAAAKYVTIWPVNVFPVDPERKQPVVKTGKGHRDGSTRDPAQIRLWWQRWPDARVGIVTGRVVVLDVDVKTVDGFETLHDLQQRLGQLPETPCAQTPSGGAHFYFLAPEGIEIHNSVSVIGAGIDVRGIGGFVVAPPSAGYTWMIGAGPEDLSLAQLPGAWAQALARKNGSPATAPKIAKAIPDHVRQGAGRNTELTSLAGTLRRRGLGADEIRDALQAVNVRRCVPPLDDGEVARIADSVARYAPARETEARTQESDAPLRERFTDVGNAKRFVRQHGDNVRYVPQHNRWLRWTGSQWQVDHAAARVTGLAKETAEDIWNEIATTEDLATRKQIAKWAAASESHPRIRAMVALAWSEPGIAISPEQLDADPWALNVLNGTLDLHTGTLREHRRRDLITKLAPVAYDPRAECPTWQSFLRVAFAGNEGLIAFVQRASGYSLTGDVSEQCLFFPHGGGANGKSTLLNALLAMLGDYGRPAPPDLLMARYGEVHPTERADLLGARLVTSIEVEDGRRFAEVMVKWLTGGDRIKARYMRADFFEFEPTHKFWLAANHKPTVRGTDHAIWRRIHLIPFTVRIADVVEPDPHLGDKLKSELPGILRWALEGCLAWQRDGLKPPGEVTAATASYRSEMDWLATFLADCCSEEPRAITTARDLYETYKRWCERTGEHQQTQRVFGQALGERGFTRRRGAANAHVWEGLRVTHSDPCDPDSRIVGQ